MTAVLDVVVELVPPLVVAVAFLLGLRALLRHESASKRRDRNPRARRHDDRHGQPSHDRQRHDRRRMRGT